MPDDDTHIHDPHTQDVYRTVAAARPLEAPRPTVFTPPVYEPPAPTRDASPDIWQHQPTGEPATPAGPRSGGMRWVGAVAALAVVVIAALLGVQTFRHKPQVPATGATAAGATPVPSGSVALPSDVPSSTLPPTATSSTVESPERKAHAELKAARAQSLAGLDLDGRWVLQLASKYDGVVDRTQLSTRGDHVFHYVDILAEHKHLDTKVRGVGMQPMLLLAKDFGTTQNPRAARIWVTLADPGGLDSMAAAQVECATLYPGMSAAARADVCLPRRLTPPGG